MDNVVSVIERFKIKMAMPTSDATDARVEQWLPFEAEEGYPADEWLEHFKARRYCPGEAARFLVNDLPEIAKSISCVTVEVTDDTDLLGKPCKTVYYATGGWSGAEDLMGAMLGHFWIKHMQVKWERGGAFTFEVRDSFYRQEVNPSLARYTRPAAIALSDQEAAERVEAQAAWAEWERLRFVYGESEIRYERSKAKRKAAAMDLAWSERDQAKADLDAFVRRHIALAEARGAVPDGFVLRPDPGKPFPCPKCGCERSPLPACAMDGCPLCDMDGKPINMDAFAAAPRPASSTQAEGGGMGKGN